MFIETQIRINLFDVQDYLNMRSKGYPSSVAWRNTRSLNMPDGGTLWQLCHKLDEDYIPEYEPSKVTLELVAKELGLKFVYKKIIVYL